MPIYDTNLLIYPSIIIVISILIALKMKSLLLKTGTVIAIVISGFILFNTKHMVIVSTPPLSLIYLFYALLIILSTYILYFKNKLRKKKPKLSINLIPKLVWGKNARTIEPYKSKWNKIRNQLSNNVSKCQICGSPKKKKNHFECHEEWSFNQKKSIQKLEKIMVICKNCHKVKHIGLTKISKKGAYSEAKKHLIKVNKWTNNFASEYIKYSFNEVKNLNKTKSWVLDMKVLNKFMKKNKLT